MYNYYINVYENLYIYKLCTLFLFMAKKGGSDEITLGTDAWNVADGYTKIKILRQLIQLDRWDTIAQFGTEEIDENVLLDPNQIKKRRAEALERFISTLRQLIGNVKFAMKKSDHPKMSAYLERVKTLEEFIPKVYSTKEDPVDHVEVFEINEKLFSQMLKILQEIKDGVNTPLNNAGLIFRTSEEVDLDKIIAEIEEGG